MGLELVVPSPTKASKRRNADVSFEGKRKRVKADFMDIKSASEDVDSPENMVEDDKMFIDTPPTPISRPSSARPKRYICDYTGCNKAYARPKALSEHKRSHTNERPYACTQDGCAKTFRRDDHLRRHIQIAHKNERNYLCTWEGCDKRFCDSAKLKTHIAVHEGRERFKCTGYEGCSEWFRKRETLRAHIASAHQQRKPYPCDHIDEFTGDQCTNGFLSAYKLAEHKRKVHEPSRYLCHDCQHEDESGQESLSAFLFPSYAALQAHIKAVHPPICKQCSKTFSSAKALNQHVELAHSTSITLDDRRTFLCDFPGCHGSSSFGFTRRSNLNAHVRQVHDDARPFICGQTDLSKSKKCFVDGKPWDGAAACGKACQTKHHLEEHVRTAHLGLEWTQVAKKREKRAAAGLPADGRRRVQPSALNRLTGEGYATETGRDIECLIKSCPVQFFREYDLRLHCQSTHGMAEVEYVHALRDSGSSFAILFGTLDFVDDEDDDVALDREIGMPLADKVDIRTGEVVANQSASEVYPGFDAVLEQNESVFPWLDPDSSERGITLSATEYSDALLAIDPALQAHDQALDIEEVDTLMEQLQQRG